MKYKVYCVSCKYAAGLCLILPFVPAAALAAEWSIEPSISLHEEYNDNIRFTADSHPKVWQTSIRPNLKFSNKTEISEVSGQVQFGINRYFGDPSLNQTDQLLLLFASRMAERNTWSLNTSYRRDTTSELATTGLVQPRVQRSALTINPSWSHKLAERMSLRLDYQYQDVKYDSATSTDYKYKQAGASAQYTLSERDQLSLTALYSKVDYSPSSFAGPTRIDLGGGFFTVGTASGETVSASKNSVIQLELDHLFSETTSGSFSIGRGRVTSSSAQNASRYLAGLYLDTIQNTTTVRTNTNSFSAKLEKQFDTGTLSGLISRDINPSGSGLVNTSRRAISLRKSLTENLTAYLDTSIYRATYVNASSTGSRYYTFEPRLSWQLSEWWTLDGGYRYARVKYDDTTRPISANAVYVNLTYSWPKISISR